MNGSSLAFGIALVAVGAASLVAESGLFTLGPAAAFVVGGVAAWRIGTRGGLIAGLGALAGTALAMTALAVVLGGDPSIRELVRSSEPHPEARIPYELIQPLAAASGLFVGLVIGAGNLVVASIGALIGGLVHGQRGAHRGGVTPW